MTVLGRVDPRDDRGQIGGVEVLPFGLLVFVVGTLLVTNAWAVVDAKMAASSAAREAVRVYVEAPDAHQARRRALDAASRTMRGHGRDPHNSSVDISHGEDAPFMRCVPATVRVSHPVPAISLPFVGGFGEAFDVRADQTERIDPFRDGLAGDGRC